MVLGEDQAEAENHRVDQLDILDNILVSLFPVKQTNRH